MSVEFNNLTDIIDSRDVIARIEELKSLKEEADDLREAAEDMRADAESVDLSEDGGEDEANELQAEADELDTQADMAFDTDDAEELEALTALQDQAEGYAVDWQYGEALIHENYFTDYAQELAEDCGMISQDLGWPLHHIDWEAAADELKMDYTEVDFDGETYYIR